MITELQTAREECTDPGRKIDLIEEQLNDNKEDLKKFTVSALYYTGRQGVPAGELQRDLHFH